MLGPKSKSCNQFWSLDRVLRHGCLFCLGLKNTSGPHLHMWQVPVLGEVIPVQMYRRKQAEDQRVTGTGLAEVVLFLGDLDYCSLFWICQLFRTPLSLLEHSAAIPSYTHIFHSEKDRTRHQFPVVPSGQIQHAGGLHLRHTRIATPEHLVTCAGWRFHGGVGSFLGGLFETLQGFYQMTVTVFRCSSQKLAFPCFSSLCFSRHS